MLSNTMQVYFDLNTAFICVDTLHFVEKGKLMNFLEKFYMQSWAIRNNQINEESTTGSNKNLRCRNTSQERHMSTLTTSTCSETSVAPATPQLPQLDIAIPPSCKYDTPTHHNTAILAQHTTYVCSYFVH